MNTAEEKLALEFIKGHGEGHEGFVKNQFGRYIYTAGAHGINLPLVLADFADFLKDKNEEVWETVINAQIERCKSTISRFQGDENAGVRIQAQSKIIMLEEIKKEIHEQTRNQ